MRINFFDGNCQGQTNQAVFGLCDDDANPPARIDLTYVENWIATVNNPNNEQVTFTAVDKCIEIRRRDGSMDSRCDGILTSVNKIIFVELKEVRTPGWIQDGIGQLENTIQLFLANNNMDAYTYRKAHLANRRKPYFQIGIQGQSQEFYSRYRVRLYIEATISI